MPKDKATAPATKPENTTKAPAKKPAALSGTLFRKKGIEIPPAVAPTMPGQEAAPKASHGGARAGSGRSSRAEGRDGLLTSELVSRPFRISPDLDWSLSEYIHQKKGQGQKLTFQQIFENALTAYVQAEGIPLVKKPVKPE